MARKEYIELKTAIPGPRGMEWYARDRASISPSYVRPYILVADHAEGMQVVDVDGNTYLDFTAGVAVNSTGHRHPEVVQAIKDQADKLIHMSGTDFFYPIQIELAEKIKEITPGPPRRWSGTATLVPRLSRQGSSSHGTTRSARLLWPSLEAFTGGRTVP
jgi:4-aminobutyrate aminotransferase-like enzyme